MWQGMLLKQDKIVQQRNEGEWREKVEKSWSNCFNTNFIANVGSIILFKCCCQNESASFSVVTLHSDIPLLQFKACKWRLAAAVLFSFSLHKTTGCGLCCHSGMSPSQTFSSIGSTSLHTICLRLVHNLSKKFDLKMIFGPCICTITKYRLEHRPRHHWAVPHLSSNIVSSWPNTSHTLLTALPCSTLYKLKINQHSNFLPESELVQSADHHPPSPCLCPIFGNLFARILENDPRKWFVKWPPTLCDSIFCRHLFFF